MYFMLRPCIKFLAKQWSTWLFSLMLLPLLPLLLYKPCGLKLTELVLKFYEYRRGQQANWDTEQECDTGIVNYFLTETFT